MLSVPATLNWREATSFPPVIFILFHGAILGGRWLNRNAENNIENRYKMIDAMSEVYYSDFARMADCVSVILLPTVFLSVFQCF